MAVIEEFQWFANNIEDFLERSLQEYAEELATFHGKNNSINDMLKRGLNDRTCE